MYPSLINRYVFRALAVPALLGLAAYTAIFLVHQFFRLADQWVAGSLTAPDIALSLLYILPSVLVQTLPMSVLLGILIGFTRLSSDGEITALRALGVSYYRLLVPTGTLAAIGWAACAFVYLQGVPWANTQYVDLARRAAQRADINREIRPGTWVHVDSAAVFARGSDLSNPAEPWLLDVEVGFAATPARGREHWRAERARIERVAGEEGVERLRIVAEGLRTTSWWPEEPDKPPLLAHHEHRTWVGPARPLSGRVTAVTRRIHLDARLKTLDELRATMVQLAEMDRIEALVKVEPAAGEAARMTFLEDGRADWVIAARRPLLARITHVEIHKKFSIPAACMVFALCGMPLGIATRRGGRPASFVVSLGVITLWYFIYSWSEAWVEAGKMSPPTGAWLPNIALTIVGCYFLVRQRRQQRIGVYRVVRDAMLLGSVLSVVFTGLLLLDRAQGVGGEVDDFPRAPPIAAGAFLLGSIVVLAWRDPVARSLATVTDEIGKHRTGPQPAEQAGSPDLAPRPHGVPRNLVRSLEDVRGGLAFALLAVLVFVGYQVVENEEGVVAGLVELGTAWHGAALLVIVAGFGALQVVGVRVLKTIDWWILVAYAKAFVTVLASVVFLLAIFQYVDLANEIMQNDVSIWRVLELFQNLLPQMLVWGTPMAAMVAALVAFGIATKNGETTAIRCGGVSLFRLAAPIVVVALFLCVGVFLVNDFLVPRCDARAQEIKDEMAGRSAVRRALAPGFALAEQGDVLYMYDRLSSGDGPAQLFGVSVLRRDERGQVRELRVARGATWANETWTLRDGWLARLDDTLDVATTRFDKLPAPDMEGPAYFSTEKDAPEQMNFAAFRRYVRGQESAGYPVQRLQVLLQHKVAFPAATIVMVIVGLPFAFTTGRHGALYGVGLSVILYFTYFAFLALFSALGSAEYLPPTVAAWAPNAIFTLAGLYLISHVRT